MNLKDFLYLIRKEEFPVTYRCVFHGKDYPAYFLTILFQTIKKQYPFSGSLDAELCSLVDVKAHLSMSFLGNDTIYSIKNMHLLDAAEKKAWYAYLAEYKGPHRILYFSTILPKEDALMIELPEKVDRDVYKSLYTLFLADDTIPEPDHYFLEKLFKEHETITLDEACILISYHRVIGRKCDSFFSQWISKIIVPQKSFFTLSQYFFAQHPQRFLQQWNACKGDYPVEFWIAYWAEQVWQAALFVMRAQMYGTDQAKKEAFRLPFSFINKDWQRYTSQTLIQAHTALAQLDYMLKNGGTSGGLELWYHRFLTQRA